MQRHVTHTALIVASDKKLGLFLDPYQCNNVNSFIPKKQVDTLPMEIMREMLAVLTSTKACVPDVYGWRTVRAVPSAISVLLG